MLLVMLVCEHLCSGSKIIVLTLLRGISETELKKLKERNIQLE